MALPTKWMFLTLVLLSVGLEILSDTLFKKWANEQKLIFFGIGMIVYFIGTAFWAFSLQHEDLSKAIVVFTLINLVAGVLVGVFYFRESLYHFQKAGIGLAIVSVLLMEWG